MGTGDVILNVHEWYFLLTLGHCRSYVANKITLFNLIDQGDAIQHNNTLQNDKE